MEVPPALKKNYLSRRVKDLEESLIALEKKDQAFFQRVGHQLKGNAITYGFPELGTLGAQMEEAAKAGDWTQIQAYAAQFKQIVDAIQKIPLD